MKLRVLSIAAILILGMAAIAQAASIQLENGAFQVTGWVAPATAPAKGWASVFSIYAGTGDVPALSGSYTVQNGVLSFRPAFPFAPGVGYRAIFHPPDGGAPVEQSFAGVPKPTNPVARVLQIYPTADVLPSNQLRLYIYFSAPMSRREASQHIHILDGNGKLLPNVFLPAEELWDPNFERLTMTFDPGRIKRGLTSNERIGPPIAPGKRYTLVIDRDWPDARGVPMVEGFRKSFTGGPPDRTAPDPKQWKLSAPRAGTLAPLIVSFPQPMNYPLLQRMLQVSSSKGDLAGTVAIDRHETRWMFTPRSPWTAGTYRLVADTGLEDLAGNHIGQLFDIDVFHRVTEHITTNSIALPFTITGGSSH